MTSNFFIEVRARIPEQLSELNELAGNLLYAWERQVRGLFWQMDAQLWERCGHNPQRFLRRLSQERLDALAHDKSFLEEYQRALKTLRSYKQRTRRPTPELHTPVNPQRDLVAYFCAEYGLHESLPIYSGGLGILAGDHLKAASGLGLPFVAVGLMYHQGYFIQQIDGHGQQKAVLTPHELQDLSISPVLDEQGAPLSVMVPMAGREVRAVAWMVEVGHLKLYLLDTDVDGNSPTDRGITYQLYGGGQELRLAQELVLGVGGVRVLRALGLQPSAWHINEGHAAFQIIERCREEVAKGLSLEAALERVAGSTVFTTHTPVPAGHDLFAHDLAVANLGPYAQAMGVDVSRILSLGDSPGGEHKFNMTALGLRGSRRCNGVSRIHEGVSSEMESYVWPQIPPEENPLQHITNGVHVATFLARQWANLLDAHSPGWGTRLQDRQFWADAVNRIPDQSFWAHHQALKQELLAYTRELLTRQHRRNGLGEAHIERRLCGLRVMGSSPLVIGFARRFATYKRATLLLRDKERLARLLNHSERPVILLFAGKAHPADEPGKALIRELCEVSNEPEFANRLFVLENYDLSLSRKLVTGVDVWLNLPIYPLEACGTSGQKAGMNGALNVSVLDGWWAEGYDGENGWAITPRATETPESRDAYEAEELYDLLEDEVIPLYYAQDSVGYPPGWVQRCKAAMMGIIPRFNAERMVLDYLEQMYLPAQEHGRSLSDDNVVNELVAWKQSIRHSWPGVTLKRGDENAMVVDTGSELTISVRVQLNGLAAEHVQVETVLCRVEEDGSTENAVCYRLEHDGVDAEGCTRYQLRVQLDNAGKYSYRIRAYPLHPLLAHPFEMGLMHWL